MGMVKHGILGSVSVGNGAVASVRDWETSVTSTPPSYVSSSTKAMTAVFSGHKDWSGSFKHYGHTPPLFMGAFTFTGSEDGALGVGGTAVVDSFDFNLDIEGGGLIETGVSFSGNGALTPGAAVLADEGEMTIFSAVGCKVELCPAGEEATPASWVELDDVRTVSFSFTASNAEARGSGMAGWTQRRPGNIAGTLSISIYDTAATRIAPNTLKAVRVYVTDVLYWEFRWMQFKEASGGAVDIEGPGVIAYTANADYTGYWLDGVTRTEGLINTPATVPVTLWPPAV